jgi:hypothetical protein
MAPPPIASRERLIGWASTRPRIRSSSTPAGQRLAESLAFFEFLREEMPALLARWRERQT